MIGRLARDAPRLLSMEISDLTDDDRETIAASLRARRDEGVERPLLPLDFDADGDGICDAFGLDAFGSLVLVSGVDIADTLAMSDGTGFETPDDDEDDDNG
ncbi:hypothetical protein SEA_PHONEGINGI_27 [Microbacterium phage Phonegingi]|nr:hypothetical protein SEA_PHONEGINGI_27 [Microbacterium phage Phonegingi]